MSLRQLAAASGVSISTISRIERGVLDPTLGVADRILHCLGLHVEIVEGIPPVEGSGSGDDESLLPSRGRPDLATLTEVLDQFACSNPRLAEDAYGSTALLVDVPAAWTHARTLSIVGHLLGLGYSMSVIADQEGSDAAEFAREKARPYSDR